MTTHDTEHLSDVDAAIAAGIALAGPQPIDDHEGIYSQVIPAGADLRILDVRDIDAKHAAHPERKTGTFHVQDAASFVDYIAKHADAGTEIWADLTRRQLVGVINAHAWHDGKAGHADHRVVLELNASRAWKTWTQLDKKWMTQLEFAEHLEDNAVDIVTPDAATMLEIAETFQTSTSSDFKSAQRLHSGLIAFRWEETAAARAGETGELEIPTRFTLCLPPFDGSEELGVEARFRYRVRQGQLTLSYALLNTDRILRDAFIEIVDAVRVGTEPLHDGNIAVLTGRTHGGA